MGLMDLISGATGGGGSSGGSLMQTLMGIVNSQEGGVSGLLEKLRAGGLGAHVDSWVGTGQNQPVSADQVSKALGPQELSRLATQAGVTKEEAAQHLAQHLPNLVDKCTPDGKIPEGGLTQAMGMFKGLLGQ